MLATFIVVFREMIEAGLVVGIVLAATRGVVGRGRWVGYGIAAGVAGSCLVAALAGTISAALEGFGQEMFNVGVLGLAVVMLAWHNVWMARHGREIAQEMKALGHAVTHGSRSLMALAVVIGLAVMREGSEVVLFLYGIGLAGKDSLLSMTGGAAMGFALGAILSALMYMGLMHIPAKRLFTVTGWMLTLLAAGMAAQAVNFLEQADVLTLGTQVLWDSSAILSENSVAGKILHTLIGYMDRPTAMQVGVYVATVAGIFTLMRLFGHAPHKQPVTVSA